MSSTNDINEYLNRLRNGEKCLDELFNAVAGYVKYIAYKYLVDKSFVNDVVMDTFCRVLDYIQSYAEGQNGKAWICKIAQNAAYSINARESKHSHLSLDEVDEESACVADDLQALEFAADLHNALSKLPEKDREVVEMRILEDMTFEEIADKLNMYVGTVYKAFIRSVKKINKEIL